MKTFGLLLAVLSSAVLALARQEPASPAQNAGHWQIGEARRGRELFLGRGRCVECHRAAGEGSFVKGPSLDEHWADGPKLRDRLQLRTKPAGYEEGVPGDAYLLESLLEPEAYRTDDVSGATMPSATGPLLRLDRQDLADLLEWLNPGIQPGIPRWVPAVEPPGPNPWDEIPLGDSKRGELLFFRPDDSACSGCHIVRLPRLRSRFHPPFWVQGGLAGPELTRVALIATPQQVLEAILRPALAQTYGIRNSLAVTEGERVFAGSLLAAGDDGLLILEADPAGARFQWLNREHLAALEPADSRMTHVFAEILGVPDRLDLLAFLRQAAMESLELGDAALPGRTLGALDPCAALYSGEWPAEAHPELLQRISGINVKR